MEECEKLCITELQDCLKNCQADDCNSICFRDQGACYEACPCTSGLCYEGCIDCENPICTDTSPTVAPNTGVLVLGQMGKTMKTPFVMQMNGKEFVLSHLFK